MSGAPADRAAGLWLRLLGERLAAQLERIEQQLAELRHEVAELRGPGQANHAPPALAPLEEALRALEKQVGRAGREQLKANSIAEAQADQISALLEQVRASEAQRAAEAGAQREQAHAGLAAARLEVARSCCPRSTASTPRCALGRRCWRVRQRRPLRHTGPKAYSPGCCWAIRLRQALGQPPRRPSCAPGWPPGCKG